MIKEPNYKGAEFKLSMNGKSTNAPLVNAEKMNIGGGYVGYQFSWEAPLDPNGPVGDGAYDIAGRAGEMMAFVIFSGGGGRAFWACSITCQGS